MKKRILSRSRGAFIGLLAVGLVSFSGDGAAYQSPIDDSRQDYGAGASRKLGRGLANTGLGWVEVFKGMQDVGEESGFWAGATWGPIYGTLNALRRTAVGVYETATFAIEGPNRFDPILEPEFVLHES